MKKNHVLIIVSVIILISIYLLANIPINRHFETDSKGLYGKKFNSKRRELGIPTIGNTWFIKHSSPKMCVWVPKIQTLYLPFHKDKFTNFDKEGNIISEEDSYSKYSNDIKKTEYILQLKYDFTITNNNQQAILISYNKVNKYGIENLVESIQDTILLPQADSILSSWGLSRIDTL